MFVRRALTMCAGSVALMLAVGAREMCAQTKRTADAASSPAPLSRGAYTTAQAARGERAYRTSCNSCHAPSAYTGESFTQLWVGRTAYDLVSLLRRTMPNDDPGGLPKQQYVDIVAYLFRLNGYPPGVRALSSEDAVLRRVRIDPLPARSR
jgi:hypothetical protein